MDSAVTLYQHVKRPQWGLAVMSWEGDDRRRYLFQDGEVRTIKADYYSMMGEVSELPEGSAEVVTDLLKRLETTRTRRELSKKASPRNKPVLTFDEQCKAFLIEYPKGFADPEWLANVRGEEGGRKLKRLRHAAMANASAKLAKDALKELMDAGDFKTVCETVAAVLKSTDLVRAAADVKPVAALPEEKHQDFAKAVFELLHGEGAYEARFTSFVLYAPSADGAETSWPLATVLSALVYPTDHICVRPSSFRSQARWFDPNLRYNVRPTGKLYVRFLEMGRTVHSALNKLETKPRDLMDTFDFIRLTLRPRAVKLIKG